MVFCFCDLFYLFSFLSIFQLEVEHNNIANNANKQFSRIKRTQIFMRKVFVGPHFCINKYINILGCYRLPPLK